MMTVLDYIRQEPEERMKDVVYPVGAVTIDSENIVEHEDIDWKLQKAIGDEIGCIHEIDISSIMEDK